MQLKLIDFAFGGMVGVAISAAGLIGAQRIDLVSIGQEATPQCLMAATGAPSAHGLPPDQLAALSRPAIPPVDPARMGAIAAKYRYTPPS